MRSPITPSFYPKFFASMRKATTALGLLTKDAQDGYYKRVLSEEAHCTSVRELPSLTAFEACLSRFATDAQDYSRAIDPEVEKQKRRAYVVKVLAAQIMQLKGLDDTTARAYFDGVLRQARPSAGSYAPSESFYLDLSAGSLLLALQILDSHLRRLKKTIFPTFPRRFNDRVKFFKLDGIWLVEPVDKWYYHNLPFRVEF